MYIGSRERESQSLRSVPWSMVRDLRDLSSGGRMSLLRQSSSSPVPYPKTRVEISRLISSSPMREQEVRKRARATVSLCIPREKTNRFLSNPKNKYGRRQGN